MSKLAALKSLDSLSGVATLLGIKPSALSHALYVVPEHLRYIQFPVTKKTGGVRLINAPNLALKSIQSKLALLLQECCDEMRTRRYPGQQKSKGEISHGFKPGLTIITNALPHRNKRYVFNIDIENYFGSINFGRIRGFLITDRSFGLHPAVATVLAQIACHNNELPQGSPCSPIISNLIGHLLDMPLARLAKTVGCSYTRYADDLTFSTNLRNFPADVATVDEAAPGGWRPSATLEALIRRSGFSINERKTRMLYSSSSQIVTGIVINQKPNVAANYRYRVRSMVDSLVRTGAYDIKTVRREPNGEIVEQITRGSKLQLRGMLSHIDYVERDNEVRAELAEIPYETLEGRMRLFRRFHYYDKYYSPASPLLICEGKTDNIYIRCALRALSEFYPDLINDQKLSFQLHDYSSKRSEKLSLLTGGVGGICNFLKHFAKEKLRFSGPFPEHPVIVVVDNDSGADGVFGVVSELAGIRRPQGRAPFIHVFGNVYVVPTPYAQHGRGTAIEDFFDSNTLSTRLNNKTFERNDKRADSAINYGKAAFARDVVIANHATIDFSGFHALFERIQLTIEHYRASRPARVAAAELVR